MEPNQFRETRVRITQLCNDIVLLVDKKDADASNEALDKASKLLEVLTPEAEGEIQERSVKNLELKIRVASSLIKKMKPLKSAKKKARQAAPKPHIEWTEERLETLSDNYLAKVFANMTANTDTKVYFSATGKGVRPSYQIEFSEDQMTSFSGSGHKPLKKNLSSGPNQISPPFSRSVIESVLERK